MNTPRTHPVAVIFFVMGLFFLVVPPIALALMATGVLLHFQAARVARHHQVVADRRKQQARDRERWLAAKAL